MQHSMSHGYGPSSVTSHANMDHVSCINPRIHICQDLFSNYSLVVNSFLSEYVALSHSIRALLSLKSLIKELIDNLGIDSEKLHFFSSSTIYEDNNGSIVVATSARMAPTSKHIAVKYHWIRQHAGKKFLIRKIESENQNAYIFTKGLQGQIFVRIRKFLCGW